MKKYDTRGSKIWCHDVLQFGQRYLVHPFPTRPSLTALDTKGICIQYTGCPKFHSHNPNLFSHSSRIAFETHRRTNDPLKHRKKSSTARVPDIPKNFNGKTIALRVNRTTNTQYTIKKYKVRPTYTYVNNLFTISDEKKRSPIPREEKNSRREEKKSRETQKRKNINSVERAR